MSSIALIHARTICSIALTHGRELSLRPLTIAVLDDGGHLILFEREDGASMCRFEIAFGKAYGALALGMGSRAIAQMAEERPQFFSGVSNAIGGKLIPGSGGVLIRSEGRIVGAVGVTGDLSHQDEACAIKGILASGFQPEA